jgi:translation elongation factor EF-1alpha
MPNAPQHKSPIKSTAAADAAALLISAPDKAGMQNIDRERINSILMRELGNSAFMKCQRKMDEKSEEKIKELKRKFQETKKEMLYHRQDH